MQKHPSLYHLIHEPSAGLYYIYIRKCRKQRVFQEDEQEPEEWMEKLHKTFRRSSIDSKICMRYRTNPGTSFALYSYRRNHWSNRGEVLIGAGSNHRSIPTYSTNSNNLPHTLAITPQFLHMHRKEVTTTSTKTKIYANLIKNYRRIIRNSSHSAYAWRKCAKTISLSR